MSVCENCGKVLESVYASGRFCNKWCAVSFASKINRKEKNRKVSESLIGRKYPGRATTFKYSCDKCGRKFCNLQVKFNHICKITRLRPLIMTGRLAYTYLLKHKPTGRVYYGVRMSDKPEEDLFVRYFSSSKHVLNLIKSDGMVSFDYEVRKVFSDFTLAKQWEAKVLRRTGAVASDKWLNKSISPLFSIFLDPEAEKKRALAISESMKKLWATEEYRKTQAALLTPEFRKMMSEAGKLGAGIRKKNRPSKPKVSHPTSYYRLIFIKKNGNIKQIHQNQFSAYEKCGWNYVSKD